MKSLFPTSQPYRRRDVRHNNSRTDVAFDSRRRFSVKFHVGNIFEVFLQENVFLIKARRKESPVRDRKTLEPGVNPKLTCRESHPTHDPSCPGETTGRRAYFRTAYIRWFLPFLDKTEPELYSITIHSNKRQNNEK